MLFFVKNYIQEKVWSFDWDAYLRCGSTLVCHSLCVDFGTDYVALLVWLAVDWLVWPSVKWSTSQGVREGCTEGCEERSFPWLSQLVLAWSLEMVSFFPPSLLFGDYLLTSGFPF